jgi:hypothetical protein
MLIAAYDPSTNPLNAYEWVFPLLECIHIPSFALSVGTIALVDVRLLGLGFREQSPAQILKDTMLYTVTGLTTVITSGLLLFTTDPLRYYYNSSFRTKITFLVLAIIFNFTIHRSVALKANASTIGTKLVGIVSIFLWVGVVFGGLFYAFTN